MKFIQLGNTQQCEDNGLRGIKNCVFDFAKIINGAKQYCRSVGRSNLTRSINNHLSSWSSEPKHRTTFYLELKY